MRRSGHIVRQVLEATKEAVAPGRSTMDLERVAERKIRDLGAKPAFKGYYDYPCVLCASINNEIVHGIPSERRVLKAGDIVSLDCGVVLDGYYGDSAITVAVDGLTPELQKLLDVTRESLALGIEAARVGVHKMPVQVFTVPSIARSATDRVMRCAAMRISSPAISRTRFFSRDLRVCQPDAPRRSSSPCSEP